MTQQDQTTRMEEAIRAERKPRFRYVPKLFAFVFRSAPWMCLIFLSLSTLLSFLRPVLAYIWSRYVDAAGALASTDSLWPLFGLILAYFAINYLIDLLDRYTTAYEEIERLDIVQKNRFQEMFDTRMYGKLAALPSEDFEVPAINDRIERVFAFTSDAWSGLNRQIMVKGYLIIAKTVSVLTIAASLFFLDPTLCWIVLIAPIPTLYTTFVSEKLKFRFAKDNAKTKREAAYFEKLLLGAAAKEIKTLGLHDFFFAKWKARIDGYIRAERRTQVITTLLGTSAQLVSGLAGAGATVLAIVLMTRGQLSLGGLGACMSLIVALLADTGELFGAVGSFAAKKNEATLFFDLMELPDQPMEGAPMERMEAIQAESVAYRYPLTDRYVLEDVSLTIRQGERVAFVGENGAGKTTFVRLLSGMLTPSRGAMLINGRADIAASARYDAMASVLQSPARYGTFTVSENVAMGDVHRAPEPQAVGAALAAAGFAQAPRDALLGKDIGGTDLSGGEWQKLAIARAHFRDKGFILLDEPTGNLDPIAEAEVFQKYLDLSEGRTLIMVTHRISVASLAERIVVFRGGRVVEDGTHEALLVQGGEYARLYHEQAKWYER